MKDTDRQNCIRRSLLNDAELHDFIIVIFPATHIYFVFSLYFIASVILFCKANISTMVELGENEVYGMIGGGYASNGYSLEALRKGYYWENRLEVFQKIVIDNAGIILRMIEENFKVHNDSYMDIKLLWMDHADKVTLAERIRNLVIQIDLKANFIRVCEPYEVFMDSDKAWM